MNLATIPLFDYILVAVLILFVVHGLWVGFFRQLPFAISLISSYAVSALYAGELMPLVARITESPNPKVVFGGSFLLLLIVLTLLLKFIGKLLGKGIQVKVVGWKKRVFLGVPLALIKAVILVVLLVMFLAATLSPANHFFRDSLIAPYLEQAMEIARKGIQHQEIRNDLRPRKELVPQQDAKPANEKMTSIQQEETIPPSVPPPTVQMQEVPDQRKENDPSSSTEIIQ